MGQQVAILYSFRRCPYAMRARMGLCISGIEYEHREIILRDKPAHMLAASPKGTVPVFIKTDGTVIEQSLDIALWALGQNDADNGFMGDWLVGYDDALVAQNDGPFKHHLDRYKYASRHNAELSRGAVDLGHRAQAMEILSVLNQKLEGSIYLTGERQNFTDIAIFPFIRQFAAVEPNWWQEMPHSALRTWLAQHMASDLFTQIMTKHPVWEPN